MAPDYLEKIPTPRNPANVGERGIGGEGGIRTPGTVARTPHFECGAIDHSATSPALLRSRAVTWSIHRACASRAEVNSG